MQSEVLKWSGGAFVHNHFRVEDLIRDTETSSNNREILMLLSRYKDGSFSLRAITTYLNHLLGQNILITDTQHPSYVLDDNYDDFTDQDKEPYFRPEAVGATVDLLTDCIVERMKLIRRFSDLSHVLSGVEVDILSPDGGLTVHNDGLSKLDYVTASYHSSIWRAAGNSDPSIGECMDMYHQVVENPHVDTISHPTFYLPSEQKLDMTAHEWLELFRNMRQRQVAFEINLDSTNLIHDPTDNLDRELIRQAMEEGVPLIIGFDFHYPEDWGCLPSPGLVLTETEATQLFDEHLKNGGIDRLLTKVLSNIHALQEMGIQPQDIVNSSPDLFTSWLKNRQHDR